MITEQTTTQSQLFTIRIWREALADGRFEIRGQVKHVSSEETIFFRKWPELHDFLTQHMTGTNAITSVK